MASNSIKLNALQMAEFCAQGVIRLDGIVPDELNERAIKELRAGEVPNQGPGVPLFDHFKEGTTMGDMLRLPEVLGAIESLVGAAPTFDHQFAHVRGPEETQAQHLHADAIIDPRDDAFDIQLFYFPHDITEDMGGTMFVPGTHLRRVNEMDIAMYRNVRGLKRFSGKAGTVMIFHHGVWHAGGCNKSDQWRTMFKIRMNPTVPQTGLADFSDLEELWAADKSDPMFMWMLKDQSSLFHTLAKAAPWFETAGGRLEVANRCRFFRYVSGAKDFDIDYWLSRVENVPA